MEQSFLVLKKNANIDSVLAHIKTKQKYFTEIKVVQTSSMNHENFFAKLSDSTISLSFEDKNIDGFTPDFWVYKTNKSVVGITNIN
jgi:hypothetical protein